MVSSWFNNENTDLRTDMTPPPSSSTTAPERRWSVASLLLPGKTESSTTKIPPPSPMVLAAEIRHQILFDRAQRLRDETNINFLLENPEQFAKLKMELRKSGAVTNAVLQHGIHFYARENGRRSIA